VANLSAIRSLGLIVALFTCSWPANDDPYTLLRPAIDEQFDFTGSMVFEVESWAEDPVMLQMFMLKNEGTKIVWIHPSTVQGQTFVDDGKTVRQYMPDQKYVRVRPSFHTFWPNYSSQLNLVKKNYVVKEVGRGSRLGRPVVTLVATAKNPELGVRKITIDRNFPIVLEDIHTVGDNSIYRLRTFDLEELKASQVSLKIDIPSDVKSVRAWGPEKVTDIKYAAGAVGFTPQIPTKLPYGFEIFAKQLVGMENDPFFVSRITDGMLVGHVYEWKYKNGQMRSKLDIKAMLVDKQKDIAYSILGDIPPEASMKVLKAFTTGQ
jgi:hypothetical protein